MSSPAFLPAAPLPRFRPRPASTSGSASGSAFPSASLPHRMCAAPPPSPPPTRRRLLRRVALAAAASLSLHLAPTQPPSLPHLDLAPCAHATLVHTPSTHGTLVHTPSGPALPALRRPSPRPRASLTSPLPMSPAVEAQMLLRMLVAVLCGAIIGLERRAASANAGIRTLSLVSLGSAVFALTSLHGLGGDPSRMGAAISTGIGFLGAGAINGDIPGSQRQLVTAASIWIAAALGVAAASGLFAMALAGAIGTVWILRWQLLYRVARRVALRWAARAATLCGWKAPAPTSARGKDKDNGNDPDDEATKLREGYESWKS